MYVIFNLGNQLQKIVLEPERLTVFVGRQYHIIRKKYSFIWKYIFGCDSKMF